MRDISNFFETEIVSILSATSHSKVAVNLTIPGRSEVKRPNINYANATEVPSCFNKFRASKIGKTDSKISYLELGNMKGI